MGSSPAVRVLSSRLNDHGYDVEIDSRPYSFMNYSNLKEDELYSTEDLCIVVFLTKDMTKGAFSKDPNYLNNFLNSLNEQFRIVIPIIVNEVIFDFVKLNQLYVDTTTSFDIASVANKITTILDPKDEDHNSKSSFIIRLNELLKEEPNNEKEEKAKETLEKQFNEIEKSMRLFRRILIDHIEPMINAANDLLKKTLGYRLRIETDAYEKKELNKYNYMLHLNSLNGSDDAQTLKGIRLTISIMLIKSNLVMFKETPTLFFEGFMKKNQLRVAESLDEKFGDIYELDVISGDIIERVLLDFISKNVNPS